MQDILSKKQVEFIKNATRPWNLAHGSVRSGKTVGTLFRFLHACATCPDSDIAMLGHTSTTIYENAIRLIFDHPAFKVFKLFCNWVPSKHELYFRDKVIKTIGAKDEGAIGLIQGRTLSLVYCDEMTLYPESVINMIDTRLSKPHSQGFASMNPSYPNHILKQWIDKGENGDENYYSLHYTLDDNPYLDEDYKNRIRNSLSGVFYKRNYLGLWCLAEGAIFDFFDKKLHVIPHYKRPNAEYYIMGIDYGTSNAFACLVIGVHTGRFDQTGRKLWVEKEYYWNSQSTHQQKTNYEYAVEVEKLYNLYPIKNVYLDPSSLSFKVELARLGMHVTPADNDIENGIQYVTSEMAKGNLVICDTCPNTIKEIEGYVWDVKKTKKGIDRPLKELDHAMDALRYAVFTHKVPKYYDNDDFGRTLGYAKSNSRF